MQRIIALSILFGLLIVLPTQRTVSAAAQQQRNTPTPTPAPEQGASGGLGNVVEIDAPTFYWFESDYLTALVPTAWPSQEMELNEAEGTFTVMAAASEDLMDIEEQGVLVVVQAADGDIAPTEVLDSFELPSDECSGGERSEATHVFAGRIYASVYDMWTDCPSEDTNLYVLITQSEDIDAVLFAVFFAPAQMADIAFDVFRNTINIVDVPPLDMPVRPSTPPTRLPESTPTPAAEDEPANEPANEDSAVVAADRLNVRGGPGTGFERIAAVERGDVLTILGRNTDCTWINILTPDNVQGWVAAGAQYVTFDVACSSLPLVAAPPTPTPPPATPTPPATNTPVAAAPTATATPESAADDSGLDPSLGCFLFENQIGVEVTITFTRRSDSWNVTFRVPRGESIVRCFDPGDYTYTLDAPPPWDSTNGELCIGAGDRIRFPIQER